MGEIKTWLENHSIRSESPSLSSSSASTTTSHEIHRTPVLCEDSSFNSLESIASTQIRAPKFKPSISHSCIGSLKTLTPQTSCLAVHMTNNTLYAASMNEINVFYLTSYELVDSFGSGSGSVKSISFSEKKIFTAHQDSKIRVWQLVITSSSHKKHQLISTLPTVKDRFFKCMLPKNYVQVRRHKQKLWIEHSDTVSGLTVNNDVGLLYSVSWDKSLKIWNISSDIHCLESVNAHSDAVNAVVVDSVDGTVYTGCADGQIKVWKKSGDSKKHLLIASLTKHESSVNALALMNDGSVLCSGGRDRVILVWEREESENYMVVRCSLMGHSGAVLCLVHVNGLLISGSYDKTVRIWKYGKNYDEGYCCLMILEGHCKPVKSLVAISDGDFDDNLSVFSGSLDGEIRVWKVMISDDRS